MKKTRLVRLTEIQILLQSKRLITARVIAEKYGISIRTVYRDIQTLQQSGMPIINVEGKGYQLMEGYTLPPIMFTQKEANALITAQQFIASNKDQSFVQHHQEAITKIQAILQSSQKEKTALLQDRIQVRINQEYVKTSNNLMTIQTAIGNARVLHIEYLSLEEVKTKRNIEPFALYNTQNNWVLIAFCQLRKALRAFRLDRIQRLFETSDRFEPLDMTLQEYLQKCAATRSQDNTPDTPLT